MEIVQGEDPNAKFVQNVPFKDCFILNNELHYIIQYAGTLPREPRHVLCVNLSTSGIGYVEYDTIVTHVAAKLVWNHKG